MSIYKPGLDINKIERLNNDNFFHLRGVSRLMRNIEWEVVGIIDEVIQVEIRSQRKDFDVSKFETRWGSLIRIITEIQSQSPETAVHAYWVDYETREKLGVDYSAKATTLEALKIIIASGEYYRDNPLSQSSNTIYGPRIQEAIHFSIAVHEEPIKQKRKGKDIPYITHPLTVGLILSQAGASEDVVIAGILHDTIEDCEPYGSVTREIIAKKFGLPVAKLVNSVTEKDKSLSWHERKEKALIEIAAFNQGSLLVKSGDVISNNTELIHDYETDGDSTFDRFNASKEEIISHTLRVIGVIIKAWSENPLAPSLRTIAAKLQMMSAPYFMSTYPALSIPVAEYSEKMDIECPVCGWKGSPEQGVVNSDSHFALDVSCPICEKMVLVANYSAA